MLRPLKLTLFEWGWLIFLFALAICAIALMSVGIESCMAAEKGLFIDDIGVITTYGMENEWGKEAPHHDTSNKRFTLVGGKYFNEARKWKVDGELQFTEHNAENAFESFDAKEISFNLVLKREFCQGSRLIPYLGLMAGLGWLLDHESQPEWEDAGLVGKFGGVAGADLAITPKWCLRGEYRLTHTSQPFESDVGRNFDEVSFGLIHRFNGGGLWPCK